MLIYRITEMEASSKAQHTRIREEESKDQKLKAQIDEKEKQLKVIE